MLFGIICVFNFFSIIKSENIPEAIITSNHIFLIFISITHFSIIFKELETERYKLFLLSIFFLVAGELFLSIKPIFNDIINNDFEYGKKLYYGLGANVNITAYAFTFKLPLLIYIFFKSKNKLLKTLIVISIFLVIVSILSLGTRSALIALLITAIFLIIHSFSKFKNAILVFSCFVLAPIFLNSYSNDYGSTLIEDNTKLYTQNDSSVNLRIGYYKDALNTILVNPILGIGSGNWKLHSIDLDKERIINYQVPYHVHNDFLELGAETGIFSMFSYLLFCLTPLFLFFKKTKKKSFNKIIQESYLYLLPMGVFLLDSSLNFPLARPISIIPFSFYLIYIINNSND